MKKIMFLCGFLLMISSQSYGATLWCKGKVLNLYVSAGSGLFVKPDWGDWKFLCNLNGSSGGIESQTCNSWLSIAEISMAADKNLIIKLEGVTGTCEEQADNSAFPKPAYLQLIK